MAKEQPKVHEIDGKQYVEVERKAEVGEKIIITKSLDIPVGTISEVEKIDDDYDNGSLWMVDKIMEYINGWVDCSEDEYRVLEPTDQSPEASPQSLEDITANLTRRLAELERQVADNLETIEEQSLRLTALESEPASEITFTPEQLASLIEVYRGGATHD